MGESSLNLNFSTTQLPIFNTKNLIAPINLEQPITFNSDTSTENNPPSIPSNQMSKPNAAELSKKTLETLTKIDPKTGKAVADTDKDGFVSFKEVEDFIDSDESLKGRVKAEEVFNAWEKLGGKTVKGTEVGEDKNGDKKADGIDFNGDGEINDKDRAISNENIQEVVNGNKGGAGKSELMKILQILLSGISQITQQTSQRA